MTYFCGIIYCKKRCFGYPKDCRTCKESQYSPAGTPEKPNSISFGGED